MRITYACTVLTVIAQNGQEILDSLSELKPTLVDRHERWVAQYGNDDIPQPSPGPSTPANDNRTGRRQSVSRRYDDPSSPAREEDYDRARQAEMTRREEQVRYHEEQRRLNSIAEESRRGEAHEADRKYRDDQERRREFLRREEEQQTRRENDPDSARRKDDAVNFARRAAGIASQDANHYGTPPNSAGSATNMTPEAQRRHQEFERQQADMKRREEEIIRSKRQGDIARRQEEAEAAARAARQTPAPSPSHIPGSGRSALGPSHISQFPQPHISSGDTPLQMPLESPTRFDDEYATDRENGPDTPWRPQRGQPLGTPNRAPVRTYVSPHAYWLKLKYRLLSSFRHSYPPPVTTTSPAPTPVRYPSLMSQHQLGQGYAPSLQSMFIGSGNRGMGGSSLLFVPENSTSGLYPSNALPRPSQQSTYPYGLPTPQQHNASPNYPGYNGPTRNAPVPPPPVPPHPTGPPQHDEVARISRPVDKTRADPVSKELKNVTLPRDCLPKFLSIAAINTSRNRETCGLLLGKDKGHKFAVTTLLIPKQHSTSDTCTMDEEELVMQFTEERSLITLGWVSGI